MIAALVEGFLVLALVAGAAPARAQAQQAPKVVRIGVLAGGGSGFQVGYEPFRQRLRELGYVEGRNVAFEVRNAEGRAGLYPTLAAELVRLEPDVIVVQGNAAVAALRQSTQTIPIVMAMVGDPVGAGFVASLAKPGGNITGFANLAEDISAKWLELLREAAPGVGRVAVLWDPANAAHAGMWEEIQRAGRALGVGLVTKSAKGADAIAAAFSAMAADRVGALIVLPDPAFGANLRHIAALAARHGVPAVSVFAEFPRAGGLMSYGPSFADNWRRTAEYVDRIVKGAKPADLPVGQPLKFELVVNRRAAAALGLTLPRSLLLRADEILE